MDWMESMMTESSPSTRRLHNFILPADLKWGNQRQLRCGKFELDEEISAAVDDDHRRCFSSKEASDSLHKRKKKEKLIYDPSLVSSDFRRQSGFKKMGFDVKAVTFTPPPAKKFKSSENGGGDAGDDDDDDDGGNGIAAVREKLISDIRIAADKLIWNEDMETPVEEQYCNNNSSSPEKPDSPESAAVEAKRAAGSEFDAIKYTNNKKKNHPIRLRNGGGAATRDKEEMVKFTATLSKSEIEEDFLALTGRKPPRKPKKRPRSVQKDIDSIYPGFWLTEVKAGRRYKVSANHC